MTDENQEIPPKTISESIARSIWKCPEIASVVFIAALVSTGITFSGRIDHAIDHIYPRIKNERVAAVFTIPEPYNQPGVKRDYNVIAIEREGKTQVFVEGKGNYVNLNGIQNLRFEIPQTGLLITSKDENGKLIDANNDGFTDLKVVSINPQTHVPKTDYYLFNIYDQAPEINSSMKQLLMFHTESHSIFP